MSNEIINQLRAPFAADRIEWRIGSCGEKQDGSVWARCLAYIDNRAAMERLDEVFGMNWSHREDFHQVGGQAVCVVTISVGNHPVGDTFLSRTVTGSCLVEANGDIDPFKSAASGAMKRAVVNLGVGRYLYDLPEAWAVIDPNGKYDGKTKQGTRYRWNPPQLPAWAGGGNQSPQSVRADAPAGVPVNPKKVEAYIPKPVAIQLPKEVDDILDNATKVKAIARPHPAPAAAGTGADPVIPFGNNKGKTISQLSERDLDYWANKWEPRPWEKTGKVSPKDAALKSAAQAHWSALKGGSTTKPEAPADLEVPAYEEPADDVPF